MTKDEAIATAIATLENIKQFGIDKWMFDKEEIEAFDMAIEALSAEPTDLISRADAIKAIESRQTEQWIDADVDYNNGLESAVAEIKALPSAEQVTGKLNNPCDSLLKADSESCKEQKSKLDLISRADAIEAVCEWGTNEERNGNLTMAMVSVKQNFIDMLSTLPSTDRPRGEWVKLWFKDDMWYCTSCGSPIMTDDITENNYCPNCGAKMGSD